MGFGLVVLTTAVEMMYASCVGVNQIQLCTMSARGHERTEDEWGGGGPFADLLPLLSAARMQGGRKTGCIESSCFIPRRHDERRPPRPVMELAGTSSSRLAVPPSPCAPAASLALLVFFCFLTVN